MPAAAEPIFLDKIISPEGLVQPDEVCTALRVTDGRGVRAVPGRRVRDAAVSGSGDPIAVAGGGRAPRPHPALVRSARQAFAWYR